jgi:hypothetical protein
MMTNVATLFTQPLSRADQAELLDFMPEGSVELRSVELAAGELGEPATAIAIILLSFTAITGLCAWLAAKGKGVNLGVKISVPGISGEINLHLTNETKPETIRQQLAEKGVQIPD